ncbi:hypothetical protein [Sodalis sp. dw_96]|uniref:hypothetical protein n=1 Tax=Sodalis sp. dw_96 TaxID=2719794 RepID=UPI001BD1D941|nr:hypothetical protein [Sodalis sp. dw_96]
MYDFAPLNVEEIVDHCRALAYAAVEIPHPVVKELLLYILSERLDLLDRTLDGEIVEDSVVLH